MGAAVAIGNRVGEAEDLVVVGIVVLEHHIGEHIVGGLFAFSFFQSIGKMRTSVPEIVDEIETPDGVIEPHGVASDDDR